MHSSGWTAQACLKLGLRFGSAHNMHGWWMGVSLNSWPLMYLSLHVTALKLTVHVPRKFDKVSFSLRVEESMTRSQCSSMPKTQLRLAHVPLRLGRSRPENQISVAVFVETCFSATPGEASTAAVCLGPGQGDPCCSTSSHRLCLPAEGMLCCKWPRRVRTSGLYSCRICSAAATRCLPS